MIDFPVSDGAVLLGQGVFYLLLLVFTVYTLFLAYHWYSYGTSRATATNALVVYLIIGVMLFIGLAGTLS